MGYCIYNCSDLWLHVLDIKIKYGNAMIGFRDLKHVLTKNHVVHEHLQLSTNNE